MADIITLIHEDQDWFRRRFFDLDDATSKQDLAAIWEPLATRLDTQAQAEEAIFYPNLLKVGDSGDPEDETNDAIGDHNSIRDAVAESRKHEVASLPWFEAVGKARTENGEHPDEEERRTADPSSVDRQPLAPQRRPATSRARATWTAERSEARS